MSASPVPMQEKASSNIQNSPILFVALAGTPYAKCARRLSIGSAYVINRFKASCCLPSTILLDPARRTRLPEDPNPAVLVPVRSAMTREPEVETALGEAKK